MERVCFQMFVKLDRMAEYEEEHRHVWPEVLEALNRSGWSNYSLFLNRKDGCLISYCEVDDFQSALRAVASEAITLTWQTRMAEYFVPIDGKTPAEAFEQFIEIFHLD